jgi:GTP-binding protein EngB required for normal cell division
MMVLMVENRPEEIDRVLIEELNQANIPYVVVRGAIDKLFKMNADELLEPPQTTVKDMKDEASAKGIRNFFVISNRLRFREQWDFPRLSEHIAETVKMQVEAAASSNSADSAASASSTSAASASSTST